MIKLPISEKEVGLLVCHNDGKVHWDVHSIYDRKYPKY